MFYPKSTVTLGITNKASTQSSKKQHCKVERESRGNSRGLDAQYKFLKKDMYM